MIFNLLTRFRGPRSDRADRRRLGAWLKAVPALLALLLAAGLGGVAWRQQPAALETRYVEVADAALASGDYATAYLASQRLLKFDSPQRSAHVMRLARSAKGLNDLGLALTLAAQVAPRDRAGYIPAHFFIADTVMREIGPTTNALNVVEPHLKHVLAAEPDNVSAQVLLGQYYCKIGNWSDGRAWLAQAYPHRPELAPLLSEAESMLGQPAEARRWAEKAAAHFQAEAQRDPATDTHRLRWAEAELALNHREQALRILEAGIQSTGQASYRRMAARLIAQEVKELTAPAPEDQAARLALVKRGLEHDPHNKALMLELIRMTQEEKDLLGPAVLYLKELNNQAAYRASLNYHAGMEALSRNDLARARDYLQGAYSADPANAILANNLAYLLTIAEPPNAERALEIINGVVKLYPHSPVFRETRGQVYLKLERWAPAIQEFEFSRRYFPNNAGIHESLALAYEKMGDGTRGAEFRQLALALRAAGRADQPERTP